MRGWIVLIGALLVLAQIGGASARQDTPSSDTSALSGHGYPELRVIVTDEGITAPATTGAGRHLVVLDNQRTESGGEGYSDLTLVLLPSGVTIDDVEQMWAQAEPVPPDWYADAVWTGGPVASPGETVHAVIDLQPGDWYITVGNELSAPLTVTQPASATPQVTMEPTADVTVEMVDFAFSLPEQVPAGRSVWHATNPGSQPHHIVFFEVPDQVPVDQVRALLQSPAGATPSPDVPDPSTWEISDEALLAMSPGREIWWDVDLDPGIYVVVCVEVDPPSEMFHSDLGMVDFVVATDEVGATPEA